MDLLDVLLVDCFQELYPGTICVTCWSGNNLQLDWSLHRRGRTNCR